MEYVTVDRIFSTKRGKEMKLVAFLSKNQEKVTITSAQTARASLKTGEVQIDPSFSVPINTTKGQVPASTIRILAHEFGHAIMRRADDGPGRMNNTRENENPIAVELGEAARTTYP